MKIPRAQAAGFSLVEVTLAIGVASFALIAIFGLLPVGLNSNHNAVRETEATNLMSDIVSDLRAADPGATVSPRYQISLPASNATFAATATPAAIASPAPANYFFNSPGMYSSSPSSPSPSPTAPLTTFTPTSLYLVSIYCPTPAALNGTRVATRVGIVVSWPAAATRNNLANAEGATSTFIFLDRN